MSAMHNGCARYRRRSTRAGVKMDRVTKDRRVTHSPLFFVEVFQIIARMTAQGFDPAISSTCVAQGVCIRQAGRSDQRRPRAASFRASTWA